MDTIWLNQTNNQWSGPEFGGKHLRTGIQVKIPGGHLIPHLSRAAVNCYQGTEIIFSPWPVVLALGPCNIKWTLCELKQKLIKFIKLAWLLRKKSSSIKLDITDSKQTVSSYTDIRIVLLYLTTQNITVQQ